MERFNPSLFFQYSTCPPWIWYDRYGDQSQKGEIPELAIKLMEQGVIHEEELIKELTVHTVDGFGEQALRHTTKLMQQGVEWIYQASFEMKKDGVLYSGRPDLLQKRLGDSKLGDYYYVPIDIKSASEIKRDHLFQLTLYAEFLEQAQEVFPEQAAIINGEGETMWLTLTDENRIRTWDRIQEILTVLGGTKPPLRLTSKYKNSPWFNTILRECQQANDIALIYKLDARALEALRKVGIRTVTDLAATDINHLPKLPYVKHGSLKRAQLQAQSLESGTIKWMAQPEVPDALLKLYFDIEGDPLLKVEYLFGFWIVGDPEHTHAHTGTVRTYGKDKPYYIYFLAKEPEDEAAMWNNFLSWVNSLPLSEALIYHFAAYEQIRTRKLSEIYGTSSAMEQFMERLVDLSDVVQKSVVLPLYFYSIKDIAKSRFVNYKWRHPKAGGAQSIFWYEKWLETNDQQVLKDIVDYNEDDVIATEYLHTWLNKHKSVTLE